MATVCVALTVFPLLATNSKAQTQPCFTDQQLKSVLIDIHLFNMGLMAGICARRFPELKSRATELTRKLEATYSSWIAEVDRISIGAFEQHFPGRGKEMRDKNSNAASEPSRKTAEQASMEECGNVMLTLEANIAANNWSTVTYFPLTFFEQERARIPQC